MGPDPPLLKGVHTLSGSGGEFFLILSGLAQHVTPAPYGLDVVLTVRDVGQLFAQFADKDVDNFDLRLVHTAVELVEEHLLGESCALAQAQKLQDVILLS
jgi:hypothetical protein